MSERWDTIQTSLRALAMARPGAQARLGSLHYVLGPQLDDERRLFVGLSPGGLAVLVVPLPNGDRGLSRVTAALSLAFVETVAFEFGGVSWSQPAAILECCEPALMSTFEVLLDDLARRLLAITETIRWRDLVEPLDDWASLLHRRRQLSEAEQLGLWGELMILDGAHAVDRLIAAWRGPEQAAVDFFIEGIGIEVKTSKSDLVHQIAHTQIERAAAAGDHFLCSLWGTQDPLGRSVPDLVASVRAKCSDPSMFAMRLMQVGFFAEDAPVYVERFRMMREPIWFDFQSVPRVRLVDGGVKDLRYSVVLDPSMALAASRSAQLMTRLGLLFADESGREGN
jgi:hypothetical protein